MTARIVDDRFSQKGLEDSTRQVVLTFADCVQARLTSDMVA